MATYNAGSASITIRGDTSDLAENLRADLERIQVEYDVDVGADIDRFRARMDELRSETRDIEIGVDVDDAAARARLDELARDRRVRIDVDGSGLRGVSSGANDANRSLSAMAAIKFSALAIGIAALTPALLGVAGAAAGAGAAIGAIGAAGLIGSSGIAGAFKAAGEQAKTAGTDAEDAAEKTAAAQEKVRDAIDQVANAHRDVADAQQGVVEAERKAADAQRDLNDSYQEATRYLRDMNDQLADAELSQERAEISLARARGKQAQTAVDPKASSLDRAEADLGVREAQQRLDEAKSRTADQRTDTAAANAKGVGNSDIVNSAHDKLSEADRGVVDARNRLVESNARLADSTRDLAQAQQDLAKAGSATGGGASGVDKYAEAMAKLSPNAQDFVRKMQALGPAWTALRTAVQDRMFDGIGDSITQFANQNLAGLQSGLVSIAGFMNGTFQQTLLSLTDVFSRLTADGTMQQFINSIGQGLSGIAPLISGLTEGLIQMTAAMGPGMGALFTALGSLFTQIGPQLGQLGNTLALALASIGPTLGEFINAVATGLGPVLPVLATLINSLGQALIPLMPPLSQILQIIGTALAQALQAVAPFAANFAQALANILAAVAPLIPVALNLLTAVFTPLSGVLVQLTQTMAPVIEQLLNQLRPAIEQLAPVLSQVLVSMGQTWVGVMQQLLPILPQLVNSILQLVLAFVPLLPQVAQLAATFLPILVDILVRLSPVITAVIDALTWLVNNVIVPLLIPFIQQTIQSVQGMYGTFQRMRDIVSGVLTNLGNAVMSVKDTVVNRFNDMVNFVGGLPDRIKNAAAGMWDGIKDTFKGALNWIIQAWNDFHISMHIPDSIPLIGGKGIDIETPDLPLLKAAGGPISGPGGPRDDLIPTMLSNGEYVIQAAAVSRYGVGFFDRVNAQRFADGGLVTTDETYGLPTGTNTGGYGSGGDVFPAWVHALESYGVKPSTYAGHQESDRGEPGYAPNPNHLNRGIDWAGADDAMQKFAEYLLSVAPTSSTLEQIIWQNPTTGQKIGWHGRQPDTDGSYYASDYPMHQNHVHTRFSGPLNAKPKPNPFDKNPLGTPGADTSTSWSADQNSQMDGRSTAPMYAPEAPSTSTKTDKQYPTSLSGWAGFAAQQLVGGQIKDAFSVLGVNDSPGWLKTVTDVGSAAQSNIDQQKATGISGALVSWETPEAREKRLKAFSDKQSQQKRQQSGSTNSGATTGAGTADATPSNVQPSYPLPSADPNANAGVQYAKPVVPPMPTNTPEGGIAAGTAGAKEAFWAEWVKRGWTGDLWLDTLRLFNGESGWNATAQNPSSTAYGVPQFLDSTWATVGESKSSDLNVQARAAGKYIASRPDYGNPSKAWQLWQSRSPHWYHTGGPVLGDGDIPSWLEGGEYVVNKMAARDNMPLLESINARRPLPSIRQARQGGSGTVVNNTTHISTARVEDAFREDQRARDRRAAAMIGRY